MIGDHRVVAMVPARGGSKSVPGKNIRPVQGKPLIVWTLELAKKIKEIDRLIVSTDSDEIGSVARAHGAEVYFRDPRLATDTALVIDTIQAIGRQLREEGEHADYGLLLEPTAPFRRSRDVLGCLQRLHEGGLDSVATFKPATLNPHRAWKIDDGTPSGFIEGSVPWLPRQKLPSAYQLSGDVYAFRLDRLELSDSGLLFGHCGAMVVDSENSVDIDDELDFRIAETIVREMGG